MMQNLTLALLVAILASVALAQDLLNRPLNKPQNKPTKKVPPVDDECMQCLCQASSDCDLTLKCHNAGGPYFCGPYVISWPYWHDGGRHGDKGRAHDFESCLTNKTCAEQTVRGYMNRYGQDCDRDSQITCNDFARIHKLGYGACGSDSILETDYWKKFEACYLAPYYPAPNDAGYYPPADEGNNNDYGEGVIEARDGGFPAFPGSVGAS